MTKKKEFVPFPVGTVRGPYICGKGSDHEGGIQYLVQSPNGWVPFIRQREEGKACMEEAKTYAQKILGGQ